MLHCVRGCSLGMWAEQRVDPSHEPGGNLDPSPVSLLVGGRGEARSTGPQRGDAAGSCLPWSHNVPSGGCSDLHHDCQEEGKASKLPLEKRFVSMM